MKNFVNIMKIFFDEMFECFVGPDVDEIYFRKNGKRLIKKKNTRKIELIDEVFDDFFGTSTPGIYISNVPDLVLRRKGNNRRKYLKKDNELKNNKEGSIKVSEENKQDDHLSKVLV